MFKIMIIKTPRGEAPEEVRQAWVGLVLPCIGNFGPDSVCGVLTGEVIDYGLEMYNVWQAEACEILAGTAPAAAAWWRSKGFPKAGRMFTFCEDEVLPLVENQAPDAWG